MNVFQNSELALSTLSQLSLQLVSRAALQRKPTFRSYSHTDSRQNIGLNNKILEWLPLRNDNHQQHIKLIVKMHNSSKWFG
jgi:hypothetical protein